MIVLLKLILAHLIGDFVLQPRSWVAEKEKKKIKSGKLYLHIAIHGILVLLLLGNIHYWHLALTVMLTHGIIDVLKLYRQNNDNKTKWFLIDQLLHTISLVLFYSIWFKPSWDISAHMEKEALWIYTTALLFITIASGIIIQNLLQKWSEQPEIDNTGQTNESLKNAGRYIGILERLLTFLFIIIDQWEAIGFLLAAKSVFRFGDLKESKDKKLTEYILIGTLLSFGIAIVTGILVKYALSIVKA